MAPKNRPNPQKTHPETPAGLPAGTLTHSCDPQALPFENTNELPDLQNVIGQPRAIRALQLGTEVHGAGYNTFVLGIPGSGRTTLSREYLRRKATQEPVPDDWCYVNNFENPHNPRVLRLPAGKGIEFRKDMRELIHRCDRDVSRALESKEYTQEREKVINEVKKRQETVFIKLQEQAAKFSFLIARTPSGFVLLPAADGKPLKNEDIEKLSPEQRQKLEKLRSKLSLQVENTLQQLRDMEKEAVNQLAELEQNTILYLLKPLMDSLHEKYLGIESVQVYLDALNRDLLDNAFQFRKEEKNENTTLAAKLSQSNWHARYEVNLLVDNSDLQGAPVVVESHPSYTNLLGRIEHEVIMGATRTNFTLIHPGALHRANGGYLVIPARDLLVNPYAWEGLKRVLRDGEIRMVELSQQMGLISTVTLEPEPIPLDLKVILVGTPMLYYMLRSLDEDFAKLFKVRAEFATTMERSSETEYEYGLFVRSVLDEKDLPPFNRSAVARVIEFSSRLAEDQQKLSTRFGVIADLVQEAAYWARVNESGPDGNKPEQAACIDSAAVERAIEERIFRQNLLQERLQEMYEQGMLLIDVSGTAIGQINALSVLSTGEYAFGHPSRVTAVAYPGRRGIVDIERQAKLGGRLHTKGVLILSGLLNQRYGQQGPLNLTASLTFEQTYDEIDGDSASAAEYFALLSAISRVPLRQDRAITGSLDHRGQIQPIGGVNEKVEGFFAACKAKGLSGKQGVIIPASNQRNLMLRAEVIDAVEQGLFHIWPIQTVDQGLALLSDLPPGELQEDGTYPEGCFHRAVNDGLQGFTNAMSQANNEKNAEGEPAGEGKVEEKTEEKPVKPEE